MEKAKSPPHKQQTDFYELVRKVNDYLFMESKNALKRDKETLLGVSSATIGYAAGLTQALCLTGLYGKHAYEQAITVKAKMSTLLHEFFINEALSRKMINYYESVSEVQIASSDITEAIFLERISGIGVLLKHAFFDAKRAISASEDVAESPKLFFEHMKELIEGNSFKNKTTASDEFSIRKEAYSTSKEVMSYLLGSEGFGFYYGTALCGYGNACMTLYNIGYLALDQFIMLVMTGTLDSPRYVPQAIPVDYAFEATGRINEFAEIEDLNSTHITRIFYY